MNNETTPGTVQREAHGMQWRVVHDFADILTQIDILRLRNPETVRDWDVVKDNMHRTVVRAPDPADDDVPGLYLKRFKLDKFTRRLKHLVRPTQAAKEWEVSRALEERGIPTCRVLAVAERKPGLLYQEAFLISRELPDTIPVRDYLEERRWEDVDPRERRRLIDEMASLTARMVRSGIGHDDLHVGNIMIEPDGEPGERLHILDLHRVSVGRVSRRGVTRMLVYLADSTGKRGVGSAEMVRFLRCFLRHWKGDDAVSPGLVRRWAERVQKAWDKHHRRHMRSRTKRCVVESTDFTYDRAGGYRMWRRREFPAKTALKVVDWHRMAVEGRPSRCELRKDGPRTQITRCGETGAGPVFVKAFLRESLWERVKDIFRWRGRARDAWIAHRGCRVRGVPAVPGLCLMESGNTFRGEPDYLITREVDAEADMQVLARAQSPDHERHQKLRLSADERRDLSDAVADLFRLLARTRTRHRDMKPSNILAGRRGDGWRLWLVDMDRTRFEVDWNRRLWVYHLAQCNAGLASGITLLDRLRCLRRIGKGRWSDTERLSIARDVLELSLTRDPEWLR